MPIIVTVLDNFIAHWWLQNTHTYSNRVSNHEMTSSTSAIRGQLDVERFLWLPSLHMCLHPPSHAQIALKVSNFFLKKNESSDVLSGCEDEQFGTEFKACNISSVTVIKQEQLHFKSSCFFIRHLHDLTWRGWQKTQIDFSFHSIFGWNALRFSKRGRLLKSIRPTARLLDRFIIILSSAWTSIYINCPRDVICKSNYYWLHGSLIFAKPQPSGYGDFIAGDRCI